MKTGKPETTRNLRKLYSRHPSPAVELLLLCLASAFPKPIAHAQELPRRINPADIKVEPGYRIEPVIANLSVPTTALFDGADLLIVESGWEDTAQPRVLRVKPDGEVGTVAREGLLGPVTGLLMVQDRLYISHKTKISVVEASCQLRDIVTELPSTGDHQNNNIVLGPDNKIYLGQGTVTNSAVVGVDNYLFGWLPSDPKAHDVPCQDITLVGQNFESDNPLVKPSQRVSTGAYHSFGIPSTAGEVIKGSVKCNGAILRFNLDGSGLEVFAWGMRNPFGLKFDRNGHLWNTYHGADVRGSRSIYNDPDYLVQVELGGWYGWPDYFDGQPVSDARFRAPGKPQPEALWRTHPPLSKAFLTFPTHEAANGLAFSPGGTFGFDGDAFVAMFGTFTPVTTGVNIQPAGFRVVRADLRTREVHDFASNTLSGPAYINQQGGLDRPSDLLFAPDQSLYVVDWGASTLTPEGLKLQPQSGVIWRIFRDTAAPLRTNGPLLVPPAPLPDSLHKPEVRNVPEFYEAYAFEISVVGAAILLAVTAVVFLFAWRKRTRQSSHMRRFR